MTTNTNEMNTVPTETKRRGGRRKMTEEEKAAARAAREAKKAAAAAAEAEQMKIEGNDKDTTAPVEEPTTEPKKRGGRPKKMKGGEIAVPADENGDGEEEKKPIVRRAGWSNETITKQNPEVIKEFMYIQIELLDQSLGMMPSSPDLMDKYLSSKAPDAMSRQEEIEAYGIENVQQDQMTIWPKNMFQMKTATHIPRCIYDRTYDPAVELAGGIEEELKKLPFIYDYQLKGMFKDSIGLIGRYKNNRASTLKAYKKVIDGGLFIYPRHVGIIMPEITIDEFGKEITTYDENGNLRTKQRALRTSGPTGERNAIAKSEVIPAGSTFCFRIGMADPGMRDVIIEILDYGSIRGLGQWRNSGIGTFRWRELNPKYIPYSELQVD